MSYQNVCRRKKVAEGIFNKIKSKSLKTLKKQQPEPARKIAQKVTSKQKYQTREGSLGLLCKVSMIPGGTEHPGTIG